MTSTDAIDSLGPGEPQGPGDPQGPGEPLGPGLAALLAELPPAARPHLLAIRRAWLARIRPMDAAELAAAEAGIATIWRAELLTMVEAKVLGALARGAPAPGLPSPATIARCRARLDKDRQEVSADLTELRQSRPGGAADRPSAAGATVGGSAAPGIDPARLARLLARLRAARAGQTRHAAPEPAPGAAAAAAAAAAAKAAAPERVAARPA